MTSKDELGELAELLLKFLVAKGSRLPRRIISSAKALAQVLTTVAAWSVGFFLFCLGISTLTHFQTFMFLAAIPYLAFIIAILRGGKAMRAAGLLVGWDLARDTLERGRGLRVAEEDGKKTIELDYPRVTELKSLVAAGKIVYNLILLEMISLVIFGFIPVWESPRLALALFAQGLIWMVLETPWAEKSVFEQFKPVARTMWFALVAILFVIHFSDHAYEITTTAINQTNRLDQAPSIPWIWILGLLIFTWVCYILMAPVKDKGATGFPVATTGFCVGLAILFGLLYINRADLYHGWENGFWPYPSKPGKDLVLDTALKYGREHAAYDRAHMPESSNEKPMSFDVAMGYVTDQVGSRAYEAELVKTVGMAAAEGRTPQPDDLLTIQAKTEGFQDTGRLVRAGQVISCLGDIKSVYIDHPIGPEGVEFLPQDGGLNTFKPYLSFDSNGQRLPPYSCVGLVKDEHGKMTTFLIGKNEVMIPRTGKLYGLVDVPYWDQYGHPDSEKFFVQSFRAFRFKIKNS